MPASDSAMSSAPAGPPRLRLRVGDCGQSETGVGGEKDKEVANVNHAARIVERLSIDGKPRMASGTEEVQRLPKGRVQRQRDHVGAGHHDVRHPNVVKREHILQNRPLLRRELCAGALVDRVLDVVADGARRQAEKPPQPLEKPGSRFPRRRGCWRRLIALVVRRFAHSITVPSA